MTADQLQTSATMGKPVKETKRIKSNYLFGEVPAEKKLSVDFKEQQRTCDWWLEQLALCRGILRGEQVRSCLVINGGRKFNKWQTKAFVKHFGEVDFVHAKITPEV